MALSAERKAQLDQQAFTEVMAEVRPQQMGAGALSFPMQIPQPGQQGDPSAALAGITGAAKAVGQSALPLVGAGLGARAGPMGAGVGAMAGEMGNQMLGITEPSAKQIGLQGILPAATGALGTMGRFFGGFGAQKLNAIAPEEAAIVLGRLAPKVDPRTMFKAASEGGALIPMTRTHAVLDAMKSELSNSAAAEEMRKPAINALERVKNKIVTNNGHLSPMELQGELEGLGDLGYGATGKVKGSYNQAFKAMVQDLDEAANKAVAGTPQAAALIEARQAFKRKATLDEALRNVEGATKTLRGQGDAVQFNASEVIKNLKKNRFFDSAFDKKEQADIISLMQRLNSIPALRTGAGQQFGAGRASMMLGSIGAASGIGAAIGAQQGNPIGGGGIGSAVGAIIPPVAETLRNISIAARTEVGRSLLSELLTHGKGNLLATGASILAAYAASTMAQPGSRMTQPAGGP